MAGAADMIIPILPEMHAENTVLHEETRELIKALDRRLGAVERAQDSYRQAVTADTLLSKLVTGEFDALGCLNAKCENWNA